MKIRGYKNNFWKIFYKINFGSVNSSSEKCFSNFKNDLWKIFFEIQI